MKLEEFVPVNKSVLVEVEKIEEKIGSIIIPDAEDHIHTKSGILKQVSKDFSTFIPSDHMRIFFGRYAGTLITLDSEEYLLLKEDEISGYQIIKE